MGKDIDWCLARQVWFVLLLSWCRVERIKYLTRTSTGVYLECD